MNREKKCKEQSKNEETDKYNEENIIDEIVKSITKQIKEGAEAAKQEAETKDEKI